MKEIKTYADWQDAVQTAYDQLRAVSGYLNEDRKERRAVMSVLLNLASYCGTAVDLLGWIEDSARLTTHNQQRLASRHAEYPLRKLRDIVKSVDEVCP